MIQENLWDTAQKRGSEKVIRREVMMRQMRDLEGKVRAMFVQSDLGDLVLGRLSDGNSLSNILNGGRIRHFGCKRDVGMLLALIPFRFQRSDRDKTSIAIFQSSTRTIYQTLMKGISENAKGGVREQGK